MFEGLFQPMHLMVLVIFVGIPFGIYALVRIVRKAWRG